MWTLQLATVACLSIAAKMEEGIMPPDITELQVWNPLLGLPCHSPAAGSTCQNAILDLRQLGAMDNDKSTKGLYATENLMTPEVKG